MTSPIARAAAASVLALLAGCANLRDIHAPKTIVAEPAGGAVEVKHGQRLRIPLPADPKGGYEWRRVEPPVMKVVMEGPPDERGINFTPVRDGDEKLSFEYRPVSGEGAAQRSVSYDITVR